METNRFETALLAIGGVVVVNRLVKLVERLMVPAAIALPEVPKEADVVNSPRAPFMPDVEMDEWIDQNGMPTQPGWMTPTSTPDDSM